ncbi:hypothetical protein HKCCE2091_18010 [Rhodobacterales bacterium HKCCE2091]|nr:hypothetical protein [Rhodobacterales bacterium HKCCE2091]
MTGFRMALAAAAVAFGGAAAAQSVSDADAVSSPVGDAIRSCLIGAAALDLNCFNRDGVTPNARWLSEQIAARSDEAGYLAGVTETGAVDVADVFFPLRANTNSEQVIVNGSDGPIRVAEIFFSLTPPANAITRELLREYPTAFEPGRVGIAALRILPGGDQRFVLVDVVTDGCRACAPVAESIVYMDFDGASLSGFRHLGWFPHDLSDGAEADSRRIADGDIPFLQTSLARLGYDPGPVSDGMTPETAAALSEFRVEHCIDPNRDIDEVQLALLTNPVRGFATAPCPRN